MGNRPDCAYFLLLGLCGAAFLLTIGGILTYVAFNPGSIDGHPHSALSHIPHFHHHSHHPNPHHPSYHHPEVHHPNQHHVDNHTHSVHSNSTTNNATTTNTATSGSSATNSSLTSTPKSPVENSPDPPTTIHHDHDHDHTPTYPIPIPPYHQGGHHDPIHHNPNSSAVMQSAYEAKAKQSLILAIIGPLCILLGVVLTLFVGVLALKYDCDKEPEPNISFLRLRSEMSLNFDPDKNNYELLRPSSSIGEAGGFFSINPTGLPVESS